MSALGDELWRQYGGDVLGADPQRFARDAIQRYGSGRAAARALGVDEAQIRRWRDGKVHTPVKLPQAREMARRDQAEKRTGPVEIKFRYAGRDRTLKFGEGAGGHRGVASGAERRVAEAYAKGDREAMAAALLGGINDPWYRRMMGRAHRAEQSARDDGMRGPEPGEDSDAVGVFVRS